jgi:hypothetical protein
MPYPMGTNGLDRNLQGTALGTFPADAPLLAEAFGQVPDGRLLEVNEGDTPALRREYVLGEVRAVDHALHVQHAVRHMPVTSDHGLFVQRMVRASQLESAVRNAVLDAHQSATPGRASLFDAFELGAPRPMPSDAAAPAEPPRESQPAPAKPVQTKPAEAVTAAEPASEAVAAEPGAADTPVAEEKTVARPTGAQGFRAQLQRVAADRLPGNRPLARDITTH